jgi:FKBP-type peptidyl-prolyl cis-trans isomerase SlpA
MKKVESGKTISVHYTGKFDNGEVFDSSLSEGREPLHTILGQGSLIPGFEKGLLGMSEGEKKTLNIEPTEAYGEYLDGLVTTVTKDKLPDGFKVGDVLQSNGPKGTINVTVKEVKENDVTIDANHPLAGKKLVFDIEVLEIS